VNEAVAAAQAAFHGSWRPMPAHEKSKRMLALADLLDEHKDRLIKLESLSMGLPMALGARMGEFLGPIWRYYAGFCDKQPGDYVPEGGDQSCKVVRYEPFGVCAGIGAWNASLFTMCMKMAPAVAAGNTFIFKSSERSPLGTLQVGELVARAGFPPGVINLLSGSGPTGSLLASHMEIRRISFTGSVQAGRQVQVAAAKSNLKRVTLELGGKSPSIILEDADLEKALVHSSQNFLVNSGQVCVAASRVFVHESIVQPFVDGLKSRFEMMAQMAGNPAESTTFLGPLADHHQSGRVMDFMNEAQSSGIQVVTGGTAKDNFVVPTIMMNPPADSTVWTKEIFGPVLCVRSFKDQEEAIQLANSTSYGLSSCIFTKNVPRALQISYRIEAGSVSINSSHMPDMHTPMGGWKESGSGGCEGGAAGFWSYLQPKAVLIDLS
jgi:aldehyde dehydrogenase (NAD+)